MVFESIVADLLNRFLGDYVENLDHSQLKIGIWGGKRNVTVALLRHCCVVYFIMSEK
jgi:vacuolar protein sorting-associated protein 13A/C